MKNQKKALINTIIEVNHDNNFKQYKLLMAKVSEFCKTLSPCEKAQLLARLHNASPSVLVDPALLRDEINNQWIIPSQVE